MRVTAFTMGGTIAEDEQGVVVGTPLERDDMPFLSLNDQSLELTFVEIAALQSADLALVDILDLRNAIARHLREDRSDAVLVTHGTDTLEETAFALAASLDARRPVAITGAMQAPHEPGSDALSNIRDALVALSAARELEQSPVMVVMDGIIHDATRARKGHTSARSSFTSGLAGPIGLIERDQARFVNRVLWPDLRPFKTTGQLTRSIPNVDLFTATAGGDPSVLASLATTDSIGIVVSGTGAGHIPRSHESALRSCLRAGKVVAVTSRCNEGIPFLDNEPLQSLSLETRLVVRSPFDGVKTRILMSIGGAVLGTSSKLFEALQGLWQGKEGC